MAADPPFGSVHELAAFYEVGQLQLDTAACEVIAVNVAAVDINSPLSGRKARPTIRLVDGLDREKSGLSYRVYSQGKMVANRFVPGSSLEWVMADGPPQVQQGSIGIEIPEAAVIHCAAVFNGVTQNHRWLADPANSQNPRRAVYEIFDPRFEILLDFLSKPPGKGNARDLEAGVAWLLWMSGFSVAHLGSTARTQDAADLLVTSPSGNFAVVECTTGLLRTDNKLASLVARAVEVRKRLDGSSNMHLRVLPIMITSKPRDEVSAEITQAIANGVLVLTRENLIEAVGRTLMQPNPEQIYTEAETELRNAQEKLRTGTA